MIYLKWTQSELVTLEMDALYTEVDEDGWVQREVGVCSDGVVVHRLTPSATRPGWFGNGKGVRGVLARRPQRNLAVEFRARARSSAG